MYYTKKHYPFQGFFLLFAGLSLLGCTDEDDSYTAAHPGNAIQFSVERIATRTHYEDKYEENDKVYYPIDWDAGDQIFISSEDADPGTSISGQQHAIYKVAPTDDALYHGSIAPIDPSTGSGDDTYGLHWGMGDDFDKPYTFYGAYPAQRVKGYPNEVEDMTRGTLTMQYYTNQVCKITSVENGQYESEPDMMNAYMLAKKTLPSPTADHILLDFKPIMTTLDIHITAGNYEVATGIIQPVTITGVSIITPGELKDNELQCNVQDLDEGTISLTNFYPSASSNECVFVGIDNALKSNNEKSFGYVDLFEGESLHLMAFLPPFKDVSDGTQIKIHAVGGLSFEFTLREGHNYFEAQKRIDVQLPDVSPVTTKPNNWISKLDGSTLLKEMSIPAYVCKGTETPDDIKKLLKKGVRAFDAEKFASIDIATKNINTEFVTVINNFLGNKENSNEFVIVWVDNTALVGVQNPNKDKWISFQNKINDAKGKVVFLEKHGIGDIMTNINAITKLFGYASKKNTIDFFHSDDEWQAQIIDTDQDGNPIVEINTAIYNKIVKYKEQSGCTGIVTIPGAEKSFDSSYGDLLLQAVIDCNFKLRRNSKNQQ